MAFVPVPNTMKCTLVWDLNGVNCINVWYVKKNSGRPDTDDIQEVAQLIMDWWDNIRANVSNQIRLAEIQIRGMSVEEDYQQNFNVNVTGQVSTANQPAPNNVAIVASLSGYLTGRSTRGRSYLPFVFENVMNQNFITVLFRDQILGSFADFMADLVMAGFSWVVASFWGGGIKRAVAKVTDILSVTMNTRVDSQRRRLPTMWT